MSKLRIGQGYDVHRLVANRRLILGGVEIAHDKGLLGHSDADALTHAVMDALLGAAGLPDIGHHFPPGDAKFKDADSLGLLAQVVSMLRERGYYIVNIDATVMAERPRINPHIATMKERLAGILNLPLDAIGIKATTCEGLGFVGREEGIAASAVCIIASYA